MPVVFVDGCGYRRLDGGNGRFLLFAARENGRARHRIISTRVIVFIVPPNWPSGCIGLFIQRYAAIPPAAPWPPRAARMQRHPRPGGRFCAPAKTK